MAPPDPSLQHAIYETYREDRDLPSPSAGLDARDLHILERRFKPLLAGIHRGRALELGCGDGSFLLFLEQQGFELPDGVDISASQIHAAHERGLSRVQLGDNLTTLRRHSQELELVVARDVIEHYRKADLIELMRAIHAALVPGGGLLVQTPNADGPFGSRHRYADLSHELSFTPTSVRQLLRSTGFDVVTVAPVEPIVHGPISAIRWCIWRALRIFVVLYLAAETGNLSGHILTQNMIVLARKK